MFKGIQVNPVPKWVTTARDECSVGFSSGKSRGCRLFKTEWVLLQWRRKQTRRTERNERNSHEKGPKTNQRPKSLGHRIDYVGKKWKLVKGNFLLQFLIWSRGQNFVQSFEQSCTKGYTAFVPATAQRLQFYRTRSIWGSTWNRGVKNTNTCLNFTSSLYRSHLSVQNRNLLLILLLLPVGPSHLCCHPRRVQ